MSVLARVRNQMCNGFATNFGLFLHASGTAQRVIQALAQIGLSASTKTIHSIVNSLSKETSNTIRTAGRSLQFTAAYDNLVIDFGSPGQSVVEKSPKSLWNLTTGTLINHHLDPEDLRCANEVRQHDRYNDQVVHTHEPQYTYDDLLNIGSDDSANARPLFFAWLLRRVLCTHGPAFFRQFQANVGSPASIEQLPIRKTEQVPVEAMLHDNSSVSGNINAVEDIMAQAGIKRQSETDASAAGAPPNISEYVLIVSGDLGSGERVETGKRNRAMDICEWNTLYNIIFVPGMFHVNMALVDMLWKLFIKPYATEKDPTSASNATKYLYAKTKDVNKVLKGPPTYQQMKRFLRHLGTAERLTCWRTALEARFGTSIWTDLDDPAFIPRFTLQFTWNDIVLISDELVKTYFSMLSLRNRRQTRDSSRRDYELENTMIRNYYMLLYDETVYSMNFGDIGRLEYCLIDWIPAFRAVGKHKYAYHLTTFFININYVYPEKLR